MKHPTLLSVLALGLLAAAPGSARGGEAPTFTNPLDLTNPFFPMPALGGQMVKTLAGDDGTWEMTLVSQRTRTFVVDGQAVEARELFELEFLYEWLIEVSANYFAQADDGSVYSFGEVVLVLDPAIAGEELSWLVGGAVLPTDPPGTLTADAPALFMPSEPAMGMTWNPEDLAPEIVETAVVIGLDATLATDLAAFEGCLVLHLSSDGEDQHVKYYAPGYGEVYTADREVESAITAWRHER